MRRSFTASANFSKLFLTTLLLLATHHAEAQQKTLLQRVQEVTGNHSSTNKITVYYSPQYEKKALELRSMLEGMMAYFNDNLKVKMNFTLAVMDESQWERIISTMQRRDIFMLEVDKPSGLEPFHVPYGIPLSSTPPNIVFIYFAYALLTVREQAVFNLKVQDDDEGPAMEASR